eukprot:10086174-Alexandrium_andersonii.AAC.1
MVCVCVCLERVCELGPSSRSARRALARTARGRGGQQPSPSMQGGRFSGARHRAYHASRYAGREAPTALSVAFRAGHSRRSVARAPRANSLSSFRTNPGASPNHW